MRHTISETRIETLAETSLMVLGDERTALSKEARLLMLLDGLEEADKLEVADAQGQLEQAKIAMHAAQARLDEVLHRAKQKRAILDRMRQLIKTELVANGHGLKVISEEATAAGYTYARPENLPGCSSDEKARV